jgi:hypothetical protein
MVLFTNLVHANVSITDSLFLKADTLGNQTVSVLKNKKAISKKGSTEHETFKPDPVKVVWMGAIIPGLGQIMNRRYWKVPIVYAGFTGCAYAISLNATRYEKYKLAYRDISDINDLTNSYLSLLPEGYTIDNYPGGKSGLEGNLKSFYEQYRRYRDLSIILSIGYYALTLVEAYVDAQLFDFDISPDLSMQIRPALMQNAYGKTNSAGFQLSLNLK